MTSALFTDFQIFGNSALVCITGQSFLSRAGNCGRDGLLLAKPPPGVTHFPPGSIGRIGGVYFRLQGHFLAAP